MTQTLPGGTVRRIETQKRIVRFLRESGPLTVEQIRPIAHRSDVGTWMLLQGLMRQGKIERIGGGYKGNPYRYQVAPK